MLKLAADKALVKIALISNASGTVKHVLNQLMLVKIGLIISRDAQM